MGVTWPGTFALVYILRLITNNINKLTLKMFYIGDIN